MIRIRFFKLVFCLGLVSFIVSGEERHPRLFEHCFGPSTVKYIERINPALLATVCYLLKQTNKTYFHHSGWRGGFGNHAGNALDFRLTDYKGLSRSQILIAFLNDVDVLQDYLEERGILNKVGLGIYPDTSNPFIHLDFRGVRARWAQIEGREVGFTFAQDWVLKEIARRRGALPEIKRRAFVAATGPFSAGAGDWKTTNLKMFEHCFDFSSFPGLADVDPALLATLCYFLQTQQRDYFYRFQQSDALGFALRDYQNMDSRQALISFLVDVHALKTFLEERGMWQKVEIGLYPQFSRPLIQLGLSGSPVHWGEIDGGRVDFAQALDWIKNQLR